MDEKEKLQPTFIKVTTALKKASSFLSQLRPAMAMTPFCCNRSRFLLPPVIEFATTNIPQLMLLLHQAPRPAHGHGRHGAVGGEKRKVDARPCEERPLASHLAALVAAPPYSMRPRSLVTVIVRACVEITI